MIAGTFYGHHIVACLEAGFPENAASWLERDLSERTDIGYGDIDPSTIKQTDPNVFRFELYRDTKQGLDGEGI